METITCNNLWVKWMVTNPNDPMVIIAREKISKYSKEDWEEMSEEATFLTKMLGELVLYSIPAESKLAESAFNDLVEHFHKWFFPIDKKYLLVMASLCIYHNNYSKFFNQFHPGLSKYLSTLIPVHTKNIK